MKRRTGPFSKFYEQFIADFEKGKQRTSKYTYCSTDLLKRLHGILPL